MVTRPVYENKADYCIAIKPIIIIYSIIIKLIVLQGSLLYCKEAYSIEIKLIVLQ